MGTKYGLCCASLHWYCSVLVPLAIRGSKISPPYSETLYETLTGAVTGTFSWHLQSRWLLNHGCMLFSCIAIYHVRIEVQKLTGVLNSLCVHDQVKTNAKFAHSLIPTKQVSLHGTKLCTCMQTKPLLSITCLDWNILTPHIDWGNSPHWYGVLLSQP